MPRVFSPLVLATAIVAVRACCSAATVASAPDGIGHDGPLPPAPKGFHEVDVAFCSLDHSAGRSVPGVVTVEACAQACAQATPSGCFAFEWDCGGTKAPPCIVIPTESDCGGLRRSGCGTRVYVNASFPAPPVAPPGPSPPAPPPPTSATYDVTRFEGEILPRWVEQYRVAGGATGEFSLKPGGRVPHPYATSDVAHVLCFTGQLGNLTDADRAAWSSVINRFQRDDGFFNNTDSEEASGGTLWHAAGYVPAGLALLGHAPLRRNEMFDRIASTPSLWEPTMTALLERDARPSIPNNISSGCNSGYPCAQNIASLMSWQIMTNSTFGGLATYADFVRWYYRFLTSRADPATGLWCTEAQRKKGGVINCIGGSFHIDFVFAYAASHPASTDGAAADAAFPYPAAQMNASLSLQLPSGGWTEDGMAYLNVDGIFQVTRPAVQLGRPQWAEVRSSCDRLMALVTGALNDESRLLGPVSSSSHNLPALVAAVAECQKQFPDMIRSRRPWHMCLDQVPYI